MGELIGRILRYREFLATGCSPILAGVNAPTNARSTIWNAWVRGCTTVNGVNRPPSPCNMAGVPNLAQS